MTCKYCEDEQTEGQHCYACAMIEKQSKLIQESYRYPADPADKKTFDDLKKDQGSKLVIKSIGGQKFALLEFECEMKDGHAVYTFDDFLKYKSNHPPQTSDKDNNFFGDRPAVYGFANYDREEKVKIGEGKNASKRLREQKTVLKQTTLKNMDKTEGFLLFSCGSGKMKDDPLRSRNLRLAIEALLQINFKIPLDKKTGKKRREQHVVPDENELKLALKLSKWVYDKAPSSLEREGPKFTTKHS